MECWKNEYKLNRKGVWNKQGAFICMRPKQKESLE